MIGRGKRSTRRKPAPVLLCSPQTPHDARTRTRAAAVGSQRLTAELRHGLFVIIKTFRIACVVALSFYTTDKRESGYLSRCSDGLRAGRPRFDSLPCKIFSLLHSIQTGSRAHPASCPVGLSTGIKGQGCEAEHSLPSSAEVTKGGAVISTPPCLHGVVLN
jgi:hypothetical protein